MNARSIQGSRNRRIQTWLALLATVAVVAVGLLATGCASRPAPAPAAPKVFYPPPPGLPRIQYLTSFNGLKDVEVQSRFNRFVVGDTPDVRLDKPYGIAMHDGKIYVCDTNATVMVIDLAQLRYGPLTGALEGAGRLMQPTNIAIESDGTKYVTDPARGQVVVYDRADQYVRAYGFPGKWRPVDAVPLGDRLYVADFDGGVVQVFDKASGERVKTIGDRGAPEERLVRPTNLAFDRDGELYVTDFFRFQVLKFDRDGHFKLAIGAPGDNLGHFARPKGLAVDRERRLFAVDASFANVQIFNREGRILSFFSEGGERPGDMLLPAKVAIDYDNLKYFEKYIDPNFEAEYLVLVTAQFGQRLVNVYAFGKERGKRYPTDEELRKELEQKRQQAFEKAPNP